jgi:hypothetical protein
VANPPRSTDLRNPSPSPITPNDWEWQRADDPRMEQGEANPFRRRFDRVALGFQLGGLTLGAAGCILGACMPSERPAAVVMSVLWWGIYLGCLGASLGALLALLTERAPVWPSRGPDGTSKPPTGADFDPTARKLLEPVPVRSNLLRKRTTADEQP